MKERAQRNGFALVGSLLLVGVFVLLWNFDVLPDGFWEEFFLLWPLLLAAAVVNMLLSRWRPWAGSLAAMAIVAVTLGAAWWQAADENRPPLLPRTYESISVPLDGVETVELNLTTSSGVLALGGHAPDGQLVAGDFQGMAIPAAQFSAGMRTAGSRRTLDVSLLGSWEIPFPPRRPISSGHWNLRLANGVSTDLRVAGGATTLDLNLRALNLKTLQVALGAADIKVTLPADAGRTSVEFEGTATSLHITVPAGVAARIDFEGGAPGAAIDTSRFLVQGDGSYVSPDFDTAANRVMITVHAGAGDITVR